MHDQTCAECSRSFPELLLSALVLIAGLCLSGFAQTSTPLNENPSSVWTLPAPSFPETRVFLVDQLIQPRWIGIGRIRDGSSQLAVSQDGFFALSEDGTRVDPRHLDLLAPKEQITTWTHAGDFWIGATTQGNVFVLSSHQGQLVRRMSGASKNTRRLCANPDVSLVWTIDDQGQIGKYNAASGLWSLVETPGSASALVLTRDQSLVFGLEDGRVIRRKAGSTESQEIFRHTRSVTALSEHPVANTLVSASSDKTAVLIDLNRIRPPRLIHGAAQALSAATWTDDGRILILGTQSGVLWRWRIPDTSDKTTAPRWLTTAAMTDEPIESLKVDGDTLYAVDGAGRLLQRRPIDRDEIRFGPVGMPPVGSFYHASLHPGGRRLAVVGTNHLVELFDLETGAREQPFFGHRGTTTGVAWSPDGRFLVSGSADGDAVVFDGDSGTINHRFPHPEPLNSVAWSADGRWIASGGRDDRVVIYDVSRATTHAVFTNARLDIKSVAFSRDSRLLATGSDDGHIRLYSVETKQLVAEWQAHTNSVHSVDFGSEDRWLASGSLDEELAIWNLETREKLAGIPGFHRGINVLSTHPTLDRVVNACSDGTIRVVDWRTPKTAGTVLSTQLAGVACFFLPDDGDVLGVFADGTLQRRRKDEAGLRRYPAWTQHHHVISELQRQPSGDFLLESRTSGISAGGLSWRRWSPEGFPQTPGTLAGGAAVPNPQKNGNSETMVVKFALHSECRILAPGWFVWAHPDLKAPDAGAVERSDQVSKNQTLTWFHPSGTSLQAMAIDYLDGTWVRRDHRSFQGTSPACHWTWARLDE